MAITIKSQFESAVTKANEDIFIRSYIENGKTIIEFDTRKRNYKKELGAKSKIKWRQERTVDVKELSSLYSPIVYRFIIAQGVYIDSNGEKACFTPNVEEVSTRQKVSNSTLKLCAYLAVICGVSLRNIATILTNIFSISVEKSSIKRWIDDVGNSLPSEEGMLKAMIAIKEVTECNIDAYYPSGTDVCVMVVKDEHDRILMKHETASENKEDAIAFLSKIKALGIKISFAYSDYSKSFIEAIKEVFPDAKFQADHFHTVKNIWNHLQKGFFAFRRSIKESLKNYKAKWKIKEIDELAKALWDLRWVILKKPNNLTNEERKKLQALGAQESSGFVKSFRSIIKNIVSIFDKSDSEESAKRKLARLREKIESMNENKIFRKIIKFFDDHWSEAMHYLKEDGPKKRGSNSESGMRLLRRLEKNHDGIRSDVTRTNYVKIYQDFKYLKGGNLKGFIGGLSIAG